MRNNEFKCKTEREIMIKKHVIDSFISPYENLLSTLYRLLNVKNYRGTKLQGENKGQFGYYLNRYMSDIVILFEHLDIKSVCDLGCGGGDFISILYMMGYRVKGYEIEKEIVNVSKKVFQYYDNDVIVQKDIFDLKKSDVEGYDALYFYEPFDHPDLKLKFVEHIQNITKKGQYIVFTVAGDTTIRSFSQRKKFKRIAISCDLENGSYAFQRI